MIKILKPEKLLGVLSLVVQLPYIFGLLYVGSLQSDSLLSVLPNLFLITDDKFKYNLLRV